ncbi:MAG: SDR family NAD(P)-dependent oxidoreductase, partial [Gammaproteobacteria bacterium]|nr:SDR family NAD(P)-dependent oxidoreductase [Gammaproteobacteria bacterium]NIR92715.1 SDR family NAD(P)-dependent oxidoreductase [Gammaproteobacteria bacterium]
TELNKQRENSVVLVQADLHAMHGLPTLIQETIDTWGQLDVLINNASTFYQTPVGTVSEEQWDDLLGSNL